MKDIKKIAKEILILEKKYQLTHDSALEGEITEKIAGLSITELLEIDNYIMEHMSWKLKKFWL